MSLVFDNNKVYFMPVFFNAEEKGSGINNTAPHPPAEINVISLTYETDREALESCIPDCFELLEPYVNYKFLPPFEKPDDYPWDLTPSASEWGMGSIKIDTTAWEDWPHGYRIGEGLAKLQPKRIIAARHFTYKDPGVYYTCYRLR